MPGTLRDALAEGLANAAFLKRDLEAQLDASEQLGRLESPLRDFDVARRDAARIFSELYDMTCDAAAAQAVASSWPATHYLVYRQGWRAYVDSWILCHRPDLWDG